MAQVEKSNKSKLFSNIVQRLPQPNYPFMVKGDLDNGGINQENLGTFLELLSAKREKVKNDYPNSSKNLQEALAFIQSRYPNFFSKAQVPITEINDPTKAGGYYPDENKIQISSPYAGNTVQTLGHELQHKLQWRNPESVRSNIVLGNYPSNKAVDIMSKLNQNNYADSMTQYKNIPQEKYAFETGDEISNEYELFKKLLQFKNRGMKAIIANQ